MRPALPAQQESLNRKLKKTLAVNYVEMVPLAIAAIKELNGKVDALADDRSVEHSKKETAPEGMASSPASMPSWIIAGLVAPWLPWIGLLVFGWPKGRKSR